jgi:hypothetical protein
VDENRGAALKGERVGLPLGERLPDRAGEEREVRAKPGEVADAVVCGILAG